MKNIMRTFAGLLLLSLSLSACKTNVPKEARLIPKDASVVMILDPQQLQDKLQKGGISVDTLIGRVFKSDSVDSKDKAVFDELRTNAGMDWSEKLFFFLTQKSFPDQSTGLAATVIASLKDQAKLEAFLKKQPELKDKPIQKEKEFSYMLPHKEMMVAWNEKQVIVMHYSHIAKPVYDSATMQFKQPTTVNIDAEMKQAMTRSFTQPKSESMADVTAFSDMFKDKADGYMFASSNGFIDQLNSMPFQIPKLEELLKDNYNTATLNFEEGKVTAKMNNYVNPLLGSVLKQYAGPTVDLSLIDHYPSSSIDGFWVTAFNPELIGGLLKQLEVEGLANQYLQKTLGFTCEDLYKSIKGDIAMVVSDVSMGGVEPQMKTDERSMIRKKPWGKMLFNATVGDKVRFRKLMDTAVAHGLVVKENNVYKMKPLVRSFVYMVADDNNLIVASDSLTYAQYVSKSAKAAINPDVLSRFKGKTTAFYLDLLTLLGGFPKDTAANYDRSINTARQTFKDVIATAENFDGKSIKSTFELRLQNEKQNSVVTLTSLITNIAIDMRVAARKERETEEKLFPGGVPAIIRTN